MHHLHRFVTVLSVAALPIALEACAPTPVPAASSQQPFTIEVTCSIPLNDYICTQTTTPSTTKRFVIETVSFSGQASNGQTVGANFTFKTGGSAAFVWIPVQSFGPSPSAGTGVYASTVPVRLMVDAGSTVRLEAYRNSSTNAGQNTPFAQRLNLTGYLE